ncbi:MAG TPA: bacteriohopanetetrol glucosamine biosynthesis glycosyltransferase HpnI [Bryobacteraceae bacterium]|nr:bacteriohopanetetrol glucosamine biosynthesis glycosyltransferase HpnI [Bryobacteraceae bacterium]
MQILLLALLCGAVMYSLLAMLAAWRYLASRPLKVCHCEPVSILKPIAGLDAGLGANLRTFFEQDYPRFEILFAVRDASDPAVAIIEKLQREYSRVESRLLITGEPLYANAKVYSLERMLSEAAHDLVVMSDSDTRVTRGFLRAIVAEFQDPKLGIATCPYHALAGPGLWSRLEATGLNTDFLSGILMARMIEGMRFAIGPTIAARKAALQAIGGMNKLKDHLAEDFVMGRLVSEAGFRVILSSQVIEHHIGGGDWKETAAHRMRWARSTRRSRPLGYLGQVFTMPAALAWLLLIAGPHWWPIAAIALAIRFTSARVVAKSVVNARVNWALLAFEDLLAFAFWVAGFFGSTIDWRGRLYRLHADGRFELMAEAAPGYVSREADARQ